MARSSCCLWRKFAAVSSATLGFLGMAGLLKLALCMPTDVKALRRIELACDQAEPLLLLVLLRPRRRESFEKWLWWLALLELLSTSEAPPLLRNLRCAKWRFESRLSPMLLCRSIFLYLKFSMEVVS